MIQTIFYELRYAYQEKIMQTIGLTKDLYFILEHLLHYETTSSNVYYDNNHSNDIRELDANLYAKVATASLLKTNPELKQRYWSVFGKETKGLPEDVLQKYISNAIRIPMLPNLRSLNLSNSVAIVLYEVLRQVNFDKLEEESKYFK